jgi:hypothetical protein
MINLELELEEINIIMNALGVGQFVQVAGVIKKIQEQAGPQVAAMPAEEEII